MCLLFGCTNSQPGNRVNFAGALVSSSCSVDAGSSSTRSVNFQCCIFSSNGLGTVDWWMPYLRTSNNIQHQGQGNCEVGVWHCRHHCWVWCGCAGGSCAGGSWCNNYACHRQSWWACRHDTKQSCRCSSWYCNTQLLWIIIKIYHETKGGIISTCMCVQKNKTLLIAGRHNILLMQYTESVHSSSYSLWPLIHVAINWLCASSRTPHNGYVGLNIARELPPILVADHLTVSSISLAWAVELHSFRRGGGILFPLHASCYFQARTHTCTPAPELRSSGCCQPYVLACLTEVQ